MPVRVTLLGTGTSTGVPVIGCRCRVCTSEDPRDSRTRCAAFVEAATGRGPVRIVIDTGPDFRQQALAHDVAGVDAVLFTHHHFDHVVGLDDLRPFLFANRAPIPCYAAPETAGVLRRMFRYIFADGSYPGVPLLVLREIDGPFEVASRDVPEATVSDAVMMLDLRDTSALLFKNAGTGRHNMVYRRGDGSIGWVEPS